MVHTLQRSFFHCKFMPLSVYNVYVKCIYRSQSCAQEICIRSIRLCNMYGASLRGSPHFLYTKKLYTVSHLHFEYWFLRQSLWVLAIQCYSIREDCRAAEIFVFQLRLRDHLCCCDISPAFLNFNRIFWWIWVVLDISKLFPCWFLDFGVRGDFSSIS